MCSEQSLPTWRQFDDEDFSPRCKVASVCKDLVHFVLYVFIHVIPCYIIVLFDFFFFFYIHLEDSFCT